MKGWKTAAAAFTAVFALIVFLLVRAVKKKRAKKAADK